MSTVSNVGVPVQAVAPVALPGARDVRGQDLIRREADVLPGGDAGVPAVRRAQGYVAEQFVPLGKLVAGLALVGADSAGVESADVGQQGGDFAAVHGYSVPVDSSMAASRAAVWASARVMPPAWAGPLPGSVGRYITACSSGRASCQPTSFTTPTISSH